MSGGCPLSCDMLYSTQGYDIRVIDYRGTLRTSVRDAIVATASLARFAFPLCLTKAAMRLRRRAPEPRPPTHYSWLSDLLNLPQSDFCYLRVLAAEKSTIGLVIITNSIAPNPGPEP